MHLISAQHTQHYATEEKQLSNNDFESFNEHQTRHKVTNLLNVNYLNVLKTLVVNGQAVTGDSQNTSSATFSAAYGQISVLAQRINLDSINTWIPIPFNSTGPASNMTLSTTSPATITIQKAGTYQITYSFYFSVEDAPEGFIVASTYILGLNINGTITQTAATYANRAGLYSLNYSTIIELAVNDQIQFYMESFNGGSGINANIVTLENGNAYVMQISN